MVVSVSPYTNQFLNSVVQLVHQMFFIYHHDLVIADSFVEKKEEVREAMMKSAATYLRLRGIPSLTSLKFAKSVNLIRKLL